MMSIILSKTLTISLSRIFILYKLPSYYVLSALLMCSVPTCVIKPMLQYHHSPLKVMYIYDVA